MTIVRCPRCRDEVTVPSQAGPRALVRCPLCLEEYLLAEALANAPPPLVIIGGEVEQAAIAPAIDEADEYRLAGGGFGGVTDATAAPTASVVPRPLPRGTTRLTRPRRKQSSGLFLLANYVGGGLLGLALGFVVLWWGFRRDPLDAGPRVATFAPWIVPAEFHGKAATPEAAEPARPPAIIGRDGSPSPAAKRRARATTPQPDIEMPTGEALQTLPQLDEPKSTSIVPAVEAPNLQSIEPPALEGSKAAPVENTPAQRVDKASHAGEAALPEKPADTQPSGRRGDGKAEPDLRALLPDDWPTTAAPPARPMPLVAPQEVEDAVTSTAQALTAYEDAPAANADARAEALADLHGAAGEAGRLLSYRRPDETEFAQSMTRFADQLEAAAKKPALLTGLEMLAAERFADLPDGYGFLAAGTVKSQAPVGQLYEMTLEARGKSGLVTLYITTATDPRDICQDGDQILVAGRIVEDPKVNLPGYQDKEPKVLAAGYLYAVPR